MGSSNDTRAGFWFFLVVVILATYALISITSPPATVPCSPIEANVASVSTKEIPLNAFESTNRKKQNQERIRTLLRDVAFSSSSAFSSDKSLHTGGAVTDTRNKKTRPFLFLNSNNSSNNSSAKKDTAKPVVKVALLFGLNYNKAPSNIPRLSSCHTDAVSYSAFLKDVLQFDPTNITLCMDNDTTATSTMPTKANFWKRVNETLKKIDALQKKGNDVEFHFYFSGHGTLVDAQSDTSELTGKDECIVMMDGLNGLVTDNELHSRLLKRLSEMIKQNKTNITLFALLDSCHSGTCLDLPWTFNNATGAFIRTSVKDDLAPLRCAMISGCGDLQTSAAAATSRQASALTQAFLDCCREQLALLDDSTETVSSLNITLSDLTGKMQHKLKSRQFTQIPLLSVSSKADVNAAFAAAS